MNELEYAVVDRMRYWSKNTRSKKFFFTSNQIARLFYRAKRRPAVGYTRTPISRYYVFRGMLLLNGNRLQRKPPKHLWKPYKPVKDNQKTLKHPRKRKLRK